MKTMTLRVALVAAIGMSFGTLAAPALAGNYNYHGSLQDAGQAANGTYDMKLTLYSAKTGGAVMAGPVTLYGVQVSNGNFVSDVDFGPLASLNQSGWVGVAVKSAGGDFVELDSRSSVSSPDGGCPGSWALDGNAGIPSGSYLGTADTQSLVFKVNALTGGTFATDGVNSPKFNTRGSVELAFPDGASGKNSIAAGYHGRTLHEGTFDFSPQSGTVASVPTTAVNQFIVNAPNGFGINTATAPDGNPLRDELTIRPSADLPGTNVDLTLETSVTPGYGGFVISGVPNGYFELNGLYNTAGALTYHPLMRINYFGGAAGYGQFSFNGAASGAPIRVGTSTSNGNGAFLSGTGIWTNASSRTFKDNFAAIDPVNVLEKLVTMPVKTWTYKGAHDDGLHMGPVAEDFAATFGLGSNEKYIGSIDETGVAFAAIQGLNHKMEAKNRQIETENSALKQQNTKLQTSLDAVVARLDKLESRRGE